MKRFALAAAATLALMSAPASANEIFNLTGATLQDQYGNASGSMTGSITLDASNNIVDFNFQTQAEPSGGGHSFVDVSYADMVNATLASASVSNFGYIEIYGPVGDTIFFSLQNLTASSITFFYNNSYEQQAATSTSGGNRLFTAGSFVLQTTAIPEPATWTILFGALAMLGLGMLRRSKASEQQALVS